jgi:cyclohexyl-isocyanide hydratase
VCTGALILAEAGLLKGGLSSHYPLAYKERLALYPGVEVVSGRVVTDRNRITGGGVTALRYVHRAACRPGRCRRAAADG